MRGSVAVLGGTQSRSGSPGKAGTACRPSSPRGKGVSGLQAAAEPQAWGLAFPNPTSFAQGPSGPPPTRGQQRRGCPLTWECRPAGLRGGAWPRRRRAPGRAESRPGDGAQSEPSLAFRCRGAETWRLSGCTRPARAPAAGPSALDAPPTEAAPAAPDRVPGHAGALAVRAGGCEGPGQGSQGWSRTGSRQDPRVLTGRGQAAA